MLVKVVVVDSCSVGYMVEQTVVVKLDVDLLPYLKMGLY